MSKRFAVAACVAVLTSVFPLLAQDAEVGKEYQITIDSEQENQYIGAYGQAKIGSVFVLVPNAKKDQKYKVKITDIKPNQYTGNKQASCSFEQVDGDRKGNCLGAP
ncbi:MAG TPA: TRAM domain-containing protein [Bryobacteraceae bacterium]|nr:TRAM domain-containing protein [Bryobacteraceae bacterium]